MNLTRGEFWLSTAVVIGIWILVVVLSSGCPFMYVHQWIELQAGWRKNRSYKYEDSTVYKYIIHPVQAAVTSKVNGK